MIRTVPILQKLSRIVFGLGALSLIMDTNKKINYFTWHDVYTNNSCLFKTEHCRDKLGSGKQHEFWKQVTSV